MDYSLEELGLAYRKAKVDLYYSTPPQLFDIAEYETGLNENLRCLKEKLNGEDENWIKDAEFLGDWTLVPKSIDIQDQDGGENLCFASPKEDWEQLKKHGIKPKAEFRLMARCSLEFHVLSALWIIEVGSEFDKKLSDNVYGSRLRRNAEGEFSTRALGSFKPYLKPFRDWRDGGLKAMSSALGDKKKVVALTADVSSFYHELNPQFMQDGSFLDLFGVELSSRQKKLHRLFIRALTVWAENTPLEKGLPVGLPASAVVANMALYELDQIIESKVSPFYYGRYVDDIILVAENSCNIGTISEFWDWILERTQQSKALRRDKVKKLEGRGAECILFSPTYLEDSRIAFENKKNKVFSLSGAAGLTFVKAIAEQINLRASEWRSLPDLPDSPEDLATDIIKATSHAGEHADNLRKVDALTLNRAGFALKLRDIEAYERDLPPLAWQATRHAFYEVVIDHLLTPIKFFELGQYLPRVIRMATACEDFEYLGRVFTGLRHLVKEIKFCCDISIKCAATSDYIDTLCRWEQELFSTVWESLVSAFPSKLGKRGKMSWESLDLRLYFSPEMLAWAGSLERYHYNTVADVHEYHAKLFRFDLAHSPLRLIALPKEMVTQRGLPTMQASVDIDVSTTDVVALPADIADGVRFLSGWLEWDVSIPSGLFYATRPFSLYELYMLAPDPFESVSKKAIGIVISALRGFSLTENAPTQRDGVLDVPISGKSTKRTIAVSSWKTSDSSYNAAVMRMVDPHAKERYGRLNRLINELIARPDGADYLVLPELSIPPIWFIRIARKLKGCGISLIAGVEYLHSANNTVRNQVWASLIHDGLGFPEFSLYRQDKQRPALHEEPNLFALAGLSLAPAKKWTVPPIIRHGDFFFAMLVCSELTNIRNRSELRGKIDALFIPEWNKDIDGFNPLVESAALDIHAYIVQVNNRSYGDSRIRAPFKDRWMRDVLQVKGGIHDYCVTGEIDISALRRFQSSHRSLPGKFKPVPDGFNDDMSDDRRELP